MDLKAAIVTLVSRFESERVRYALMGGFALGLWGVHRSTIGLDFLVDRRDLLKLDAIMTKLGYECLFSSENVAQYVSPVKVFGEVDFLFALREAGLAMLERAESKPIFDGESSVRVLRPEDVMGLKLQAIKNDPTRKEVDIGDIKALIGVQGAGLDRDLLRQYAELLDPSDLLTEAGLP